MREKNKTNQNNRSNNSRRGSNNKKAKDRKLIFSLFVIFSVVIFFSSAYNNLRADVKVNGGKKIVEVNTNYDDKGATATYNGEKIPQDKVKVSGQVDAGKIGKYKIEYSVEHNGITSKAKKKVEVRYTKPPVIILVGETSCNLCPKDEFAEPSYSCLDNYDKDLTKAVEVEVEYDKVIYEVKDSSGNKAQIIKTLNRKDKD